jgi:hypothetical protein
MVELLNAAVAALTVSGSRLAEDTALRTDVVDVELRVQLLPRPHH